MLFDRFEGRRALVHLLARAQDTILRGAGFIPYPPLDKERNRSPPCDRPPCEATPRLFEDPGVHPLVLEERPPVDRQPLENVIVGQPAVPLISPSGSPRVPYEERTN